MLTVLPLPQASTEHCLESPYVNLCVNENLVHSHAVTAAFCKLHRHILGTPETYITYCQKGHNRSPLNGILRYFKNSYQKNKHRFIWYEPLYRPALVLTMGNFIMIYRQTGNCSIPIAVCFTA